MSRQPINNTILADFFAVNKLTSTAKTKIQDYNLYATFYNSGLELGNQARTVFFPTTSRFPLIQE